MENEAVYTRKNCTLEEAAAFLKVSRRTIQNYQDRGLLTPVYFGKLRRFRWAEVLKLEKTGVPSMSEATTR
jgi:excisionase family DNA binding protein